MHDCWISSPHSPNYAILQNTCPNEQARSVGGVYIDNTAFEIPAYTLSGDSDLVFTCDILAYEEESLYFPPECASNRKRRFPNIDFDAIMDNVLYTNYYDDTINDTVDDIVISNPRVYLLPKISVNVTVSDRLRVAEKIEKSGKVAVLKSSLVIFFLVLFI